MQFVILNLNSLPILVSPNMTMCNLYILAIFTSTCGLCQEGALRLPCSPPGTTWPAHWSTCPVVVHAQPKKGASNFSVQEVTRETCQNPGSRFCFKTQGICGGAQGSASLMSFPSESNTGRWVDMMDHILRESMLDDAVWNPRSNFLPFIPGHSRPTLLNLSFLERPPGPLHMVLPPWCTCSVSLQCVPAHKKEHFCWSLWGLAHPDAFFPLAISTVCG